MEYKELIGRDKGVAGLNIFLAVIATIFVIGLIVMVFTLAGDNLIDNLEETDTTNFTNFTSASALSEASESFITTVQDSTNCRGLVVGALYNSSGGLMDSGNYTVHATNCSVTTNAGADGGVNATIVNITGSYVSTDNTETVFLINDTYQSLGDSTDWFSTFIVLAAMVVLILLVVIIISSIRGAGITGGGSTPRETA